MLTNDIIPDARNWKAFANGAGMEWKALALMSKIMPFAGASINENSLHLMSIHYVGNSEVNNKSVLFIKES